MKQYTATITDSDTLIDRQVSIDATNVYEAHKQVMMKHIVDYECEKVTEIVNESADIVYKETLGFYETN